MTRRPFFNLKPSTQPETIFQESPSEKAVVCNDGTFTCADIVRCAHDPYLYVPLGKPHPANIVGEFVYSDRKREGMIVEQSAEVVVIKRLG